MDLFLIHGQSEILETPIVLNVFDENHSKKRKQLDKPIVISVVFIDELKRKKLENSQNSL